ncbi:hypothetical protein [Nocardia jinanensis]|uniref:Uncharacterized protein n=2 Tax=Nocardia jinanensis TaxID=382504 RepID=A0A917VK67_9NOCA|nr:hypothetical protein [Nocardia jinanensis]GGK89907.1 hypothetical protein GCM10011588_00210 [Nocardia jinanensis]
MSQFWFRAPSIRAAMARVSARPIAGRYSGRPVVDPSLGAVTAAAVTALWSTVPGTGPASTPGEREKLVVDRDTFAASPVVTGYETRAWADLVLRAFARETNLLLPGTRFLLLGTGPVADALAGALTRIGGRLEIAGRNSIELVDLARRHGVPVRPLGEPQSIPVGIDVVVVTGSDHPPFDPGAAVAAQRPLIVVDAARPEHSGVVLPAERGATVRDLTELAGPRACFVVQAPTPDALDTATAELRALYTVLLATVGYVRAEAELAEVLTT